MISRPHLESRLEAGANQGMVVVSGPAGSGKTLLLASWAQQRGEAPAWLNVEPEDGEPERFWTAVLHALQASPGLASGPLASVHAPPRFDPRFVSFLVDACQQLSDPVVLVLEDLHLLTGTASMASLAQATRRGLGNLHLVISTRTDPPLPLQRLRIHEQLTEIRAADLAFDVSETVQLLAQYDLHLHPQQLQTLLERTEGWVTGLRLAGLALAGRDDVEEAVQNLAGDHRNVADFFVEEVLDQLSPRLMDFLLDTCLPRRMCADLANELTMRRDGQVVLAELERDNLFVVALDDRRSWYRYHHLFGELLRHRLMASSPEKVRELNLVAASWFAQHGDPLEAARHLAEAGAWSDLARFVMRYAGEQLLGVERHELVEVLQRMPDWLVLRDSEVATAAAMAAYGEYDVQRLRGHIGEARGMTHVLTGLDAAVVDALLTTLQAIDAWLEGDAAGQSEFAAAALDKLDRLPPAAIPAASAYRGKLTFLLGAGRLWTGYLDEADALLSQLERSHASHDNLPPVLAVHLHSNLAVLRAFQGRMREAQRQAEIALGLAERSGWLLLPQSAMALLAQAVVALIRGEEERAGGLLERCAASLGDLQDRYTLAGLAMVRARIELGTGRPAAAAASIAALRTGPGSWRMPWFLERWSDLLGAEIALGAGSPEEAEVLRSRLADGWDAGRPEAHRVVLLARAHLVANQPEACLETLRCVTEGARLDLVPTVDAWVVSALAHDRLRQDADALSSLERALALAEAEGIIRPFVVSGQRMRALLDRHRHVFPEHHAFVERVLARLGVDGVPATLQVALLEPLTNRERSVLQLLPTMMSNNEIADELSVSVNTIKVHLKSLYRKLGVKSRRQAVARARMLGLLEPGRVPVPV
jgi:LuxR family maltose regulon positive regulatory protein